MAGIHSAAVGATLITMAISICLSRIARKNNFLYRNNQEAGFVKITSGPVVNDGGSSYGSSWGDFDNDGDLDLFVANERENNFLYRNDGSGNFAKITNGPVVNDGGSSYGSSWGDYDNDGDLDLFVANSFGARQFFISQRWQRQLYENYQRACGQ